MSILVKNMGSVSLSFQYIAVSRRWHLLGIVVADELKTARRQSAPHPIA
jgi:hypothetical protein